VEGRHEPRLGCEGQKIKAGPDAGGLGRVEPGPECQDDQGALCRIAVDLEAAVPPDEPRLIAEKPSFRELA
jgi:hypothetical protein